MPEICRHKLQGITDLQSLENVLGAAQGIAIDVRQEDNACQDGAAEVAGPGDP